MENHKQKIKIRKGDIMCVTQRYAFLMFLFLAMPILAFSQTRTVRGTVTDTQGEAIPGASVTVNGTQRGTLTNVDGSFSIEASANDKLTVSFIGYIKKEIPVGSNTDISVQLEEDNRQLEEVVVTGYAAQKKATLTGAVSTVSNKELTVTKNENVVNMLTGKVPGVRITQRSSQPGAYNTVIDIRGMNDVTNGVRSTPLFVVDGITRDQDYFSRMSAEEIESVTVLKDAAAAVYGLRAANGVILITTKKGTAQNGKVDITYSGSYTLQQMIYIPKGVSAVDWFTLRNEQQWQNFGNNYLNRMSARHGEEEIQPWLDGTRQSYDWMGAIFKDLTPQTEHTLSIDGGNDRIRFFTNLGYSKQDGNYKSGSLWADKWNFRTNIDAKITNRLSAGVQIGAILTNTHEPNTGLWAVYKNAWLTQPNASFYANDNPEYLNGNSTYINDGDNLLASTNSDYSGYRLNKSRRLNGTLTLTYEIPGIKGLSAQTSYDYAMSLPDNTSYQHAYYLYDYGQDGKYTPMQKNAADGKSRITRSANFNYDTDMQLKLLYNNKFGLHSVNGVVVFEEAFSNWDGFQAQRNLSVNSEYLFAGDAEGQQATSSGLGDRLNQAFIGQFNYDYAGKYLADFRFRYDGSSRYPEGSRWGFFPSVSLGWRISEEGFIKNKWSFINNLKIRASYGVMGDDAAAKNYPQNYIGYDLTQTRGWVFGDSFMTSVKPGALPNPNLTWYKVKMADIGLDFDIFNSLLSGSFDIFRRDRSGLLAANTAVIPGTVGANLPDINLNDDRNFGWEIELTHRNRIRTVDYFVSGQISATRSMRTKWSETPASNSFDYWRNRTDGRYNDIYWENESGSMFTNVQDILNFSQYPMAQGSTPGDWSIVDWNGDGIIDDSDKHPIATKGLASVNFGLSMGASWNNLDLSANFQGAYGIYQQLSEVFTEALPFGGRNTMEWFMDRWRPANVNADYFNPNTEWISGYYPVTGHDGRRTGTNGMRDASYIRLKTLELGYTIPAKVLAKAGMKNLRIYFNVYNLLTISKLKGIDPERPSSVENIGATLGSAGYADMYAYPNNRTYTIGASIKF